MAKVDWYRDARLVAAAAMAASRRSSSATFASTSAMSAARETHLTRLWDHLGSWFAIEDRV